MQADKEGDGSKIKELIQNAADFLKDPIGPEGEGTEGEISNLHYVFASWLTKEGILSGTTVTMEVADDSSYKTWSWG